MRNTTIYHGSYCEVRHPDVTRSRTNIDFGGGFYLTEDYNMARKWATNKATSYVNGYSVDFTGLNVLYLKLDEQWLNYIAYNRGFTDRKPFDDSKYDVIIGPTADDRMYETLDDYFDKDIPPEDALSVEETLELLNIADHSEQIVFKTQTAIDSSLKFIKAKEIGGLEKEQLKRQTIIDRKAASAEVRNRRRQLRKEKENSLWK